MEEGSERQGPARLEEGNAWLWHKDLATCKEGVDILRVARWQHDRGGCPPSALQRTIVCGQRSP